VRFLESVTGMARHHIVMKKEASRRFYFTQTQNLNDYQEKEINMDDAILNFTFTVAEINGLLNILGNTAYVQSAALINKIQEQGTPQFAKIQAETDAANAVAEAIATDAPV